jgi:hypothetical protein
MLFARATEWSASKTGQQHIRSRPTKTAKDSAPDFREHKKTNAGCHILSQKLALFFSFRETVDSSLFAVPGPIPDWVGTFLFNNA